VIYPACHMGRDSVVALACISSYLRSRNVTLRQAVDSLPRLTMIKHKIAVDAGLPLSSILDDVQMQLPPDAIIHRTDGLYASWTDRWVHVRGSNTEPIMRIIVEADRSDTAHELLSLVQKLLTRHE
jgi:phosphomannomutase